MNQHVSGRFENKVALVTSASAGIGAATAEAFARAGARVMLSDINEVDGEALAERLRRSGADAHFLRADATVEADVERLIGQTVERFGGLHLAANVVGGAPPEALRTDFHLQTVESWDATLALSLRSTFLSMKHEIAHMIDNGGGSITNVASIAGLRYLPLVGPAYGAAKAGVIQLTKFASLAYADQGIRVNSIAPGVTLTGSVQSTASTAFPDMDPAAALERFAAQTLDGHAIKRFVKPEEQAAAIVWLSSADSAMVTGQTIFVDGGWAAR